MPRTSHGRHRQRSARATARAVGLPALVALAGSLVATVPNYAFAAQLPVGGMPPILACHGSNTPSASASPSDSTSPSASVSASGLPSASASGSQAPSSGTASASATASASSTPTSNSCGVVQAGTPAARPTHSPSSATASPRRSASPSHSAAPTTSLGSAPSTGSGGSEAAQPPVVGQEPYGPITRAQIMQRALAWVEQKVPYSQTAWWVDTEGSYRQDCSGYVSMAWGLDQAIDFWTGNLDAVSHPIPAAQMLPGDILLSPTHTVLFAGWADGAHTVFDFYEESHPGTVAHYVTGASLAAYLGGGFVPYRYDGVVGSNSGPFVTPAKGVPIAALGPLAQELAPEGKTVQAPAPAWWQTVPAPAPASTRPPTAGAARAAELEPAAAEVPEQEAGSAGVAFGGSVLLFAGLSVAMSRRRAVRAGGGRPRRRH